MDEQDVRYDATDTGGFPLLRSNMLSKKRTDELLEEVGRVLQRCCRPQTTRSDEERKEDDELLTRVNYVMISIGKISDNGALLKFFSTSICTPANLDALLRMLDADIRAGRVRCLAFNILMKLLGLNNRVWGMKMMNGTYFSSGLIGTLSKALDDEAKKDKEIPHDDGCKCVKQCFDNLGIALSAAKEEPAKLMDRIKSFDWKAIFDLPADAFQRQILFVGLHNQSVNTLIFDLNCLQAKELLKTLGSCHGLLRSTLRMILELRTLSSQSPGSLPANSSTVLSLLHDLSIFFEKFFQCLSPSPPQDPETDILVRLANLTLREIRPVVVNMIQHEEAKTAWSTMDSIERYDIELIWVTDASWWETFQTESDNDRWRRLKSTCLQDDAAECKRREKERRRNMKELTKERVEAECGKDDLCASCYTLEKDAPDGKLFKCGWCRQVFYCSRECQTLHWKKTHNKQCTRRKK
jgi:hypothetical protein